MKLLKIIVSIKTYLVMSKGELLVLKTLLETAPSEVTKFFEKKSKFSQKYYSSIWKHTTCANKAVFLPLLSRNFDDQLSSNFHRFLILCICCEMHQVRRLVFDNYQLCPKPLTTGLQIYTRVWWSLISRLYSRHTHRDREVQ